MAVIWIATTTASAASNAAWRFNGMSHWVGKDMIERLVEAGGKGLVLPVALFLLLTYAAKGLFGLQTRRGLHRKEFLELWDSIRSQDDVWLEVAMRHLCGTYLPASVLRQVMTWPERTQAILDLAEIWSLVTLDPQTQRIAWRKAMYADPLKLKWGRAMALSGYFASAGVAALLALVALGESEPMAARSMLYGTVAAVLAPAAFLCLMRDEALKKAQEVGNEWLRRLNNAAEIEVAVEVRVGEISASESAL